MKPIGAKRSCRCCAGDDWKNRARQHQRDAKTAEEQLEAVDVGCDTTREVCDPMDDP